MLGEFSEKRRAALAQRIQDHLVASLGKKADIDPYSILDRLEQIDPTSNGKYGNWLVEEWMAENFKVSEDAETVHETLLTFEEVKNRLPIKDINQFNLYELRQYLQVHGQLISKSSPQAVYLERLRSGRIKADDPSLLVYDDERYSIIRVVDHETADVLASNTAWCVKRERYARHHLEGGPLYFILEQGHPIALWWRIADGSYALSLREDAAITAERFWADYGPGDGSDLPEEAMGEIVRRLMDRRVDVIVNWDEISDSMIKDIHDQDFFANEDLRAIMDKVSLEYDAQDSVDLIGNATIELDDDEVIGTCMEVMKDIVSFSGFSKQGLRLSRKDLSGIDLSNSTMPQVSFQQSDLTGANLSGSKMQNVMFDDAVLVGANLTGAHIPLSTFGNADATGAILDDANLQYASLRDAIFVNASLRGVILKGASRATADFTGADLTGAYLD